jgi:hypothetical protein
MDNNIPAEFLLGCDDDDEDSFGGMGSIPHLKDNEVSTPTLDPYDNNPS